MKFVPVGLISNKETSHGMYTRLVLVNFPMYFAVTTMKLGQLYDWWVNIYMEKVMKSQEVKHDDVIKWKHFPRYWPFV